MKNKKCLNCETILSDLIYSKHSVFRHIRVANTASVREEWKHVLFFIKEKRKKLNQQNEF